jgi:hypothetical protein
MRRSRACSVNPCGVCCLHSKVRGEFVELVLLMLIISGITVKILVSKNCRTGGRELVESFKFSFFSPPQKQKEQRRDSHPWITQPRRSFEPKLKRQTLTFQNQENFSSPKNQGKMHCC